MVAITQHLCFDDTNVETIDAHYFCSSSFFCEVGSSTICNGTAMEIHLWMHPSPEGVEHLNHNLADDGCLSVGSFPNVAPLGTSWQLID